MQIWLLRSLVLAAVVQHCVASISMLEYRTGRIIDVYLFQHHAANALIHGVDPYTLTTENIYGPQTPLYGPEIVKDNRVQIGLPYPPVSLFFVLPFYFLGDIRYAYVAAVILSAIIVVLLRTDFFTVGIACLLLLSPITKDVELRAWTEPLVLLAATCTIYAAIKKSWWLWIALGIFMASKQYSVLSLPFVPLLLGENDWNSAWRLLRKALGAAAILTLPMALWNFHGFWRDVVLFQIRQPFRKDALTLGNLLFPFPMLTILVLVAIAIIFSISRARPHPSMFAACYGFAFLIFVCTNKQAFCNYYFLTMHVLLLAAATMRIPFKSGFGNVDQEAHLLALQPNYESFLDDRILVHHEETKVTS